jgi:hypothetical protein
VPFGAPFTASTRPSSVLLDHKFVLGISQEIKKHAEKIKRIVTSDWLLVRFATTGRRLPARTGEHHRASPPGFRPDFAVLRLIYLNAENDDPSDHTKTEGGFNAE